MSSAHRRATVETRRRKRQFLPTTVLSAHARATLHHSVPKVKWEYDLFWDGRGTQYRPHKGNRLRWPTFLTEHVNLKSRGSPNAPKPAKKQSAFLHSETPRFMAHNSPPGLEPASNKSLFHKDLKPLCLQYVSTGVFLVSTTKDAPHSWAKGPTRSEECEKTVFNDRVEKVHL
jgi:hypothetical protein